MPGLEGKWKSILVGGLIIGLSRFIPFLNLPCCVIAPLLGAFCAVALYRNSNPPSFTQNDGFTLGAMSGLIGTAIYAVLVVPFAMLMTRIAGGIMSELTPNLTDVPPAVQRLLNLIFANLGAVVGVVLVFKILSVLALSVLFGILGGIASVALLKPRSSH